MFFFFFYSRRVALEQLTSDLSRISSWGRENKVVFNASKTQFLHLSTIFHTTMISSSKTHNSNFHLFLIFLVYLFLVIFPGNITLLLFVNEVLRGWVF